MVLPDFHSLSPLVSSPPGASTSIRGTTMEQGSQTHLLTLSQHWARTTSFLRSTSQGKGFEIRCISHPHGMNKY